MACFTFPPRNTDLIPKSGIDSSLNASNSVNPTFNDKNTTNDTTTVSLPHKRHQHRRSAAISVDLNSSQGLVPSLPSQSLDSPHHKQTKSWSGLPSPCLIPDPPSIPPLISSSDIQDLSISPSPIIHSSYILSSQLVGIPSDISSSSSSHPIIDLDVALSPFSSLPLHRRSESAPDSIFDSFSSRFHSFNKPSIDHQNVILEEDDEDLASPTLPSHNTSFKSSLGNIQDAHTSSLSLLSSSTSILSCNKDRDRARLVRNYNSLSLPPPFFSTSLKNSSSSSISSDLSLNPFQNTASSNNTSFSNITSLINNTATSPPLKNNISILPNNQTTAPRMVVEDNHSAVSKSINRLSSTTNDTITPSVSTLHPPPDQIDLFAIHRKDSNKTLPSSFHLKSLRNVASFEESLPSEPLTKTSSTTQSSLKPEQKQKFRFHKKVSSMLLFSSNSLVPENNPPLNKSHSSYGLSRFSTDSKHLHKNKKRTSLRDSSTSISSSNSIVDSPKKHKKKPSRVWTWVKSPHF